MRTVQNVLSEVDMSESLAVVTSFISDDGVITSVDVDPFVSPVVAQLSDEEQAKLIFKEYRLKEQKLGVLKELAERINRYVKEQADPNLRMLKEISRKVCELRKSDDVDAYQAAQAERDALLIKIAIANFAAEQKKTKTTGEKVAHQREETDDVVSYAGKGVNRKIEEWLEKDGWVKAEKLTTAMKDKRAKLIRQYQENAVKWSKK